MSLRIESCLTIATLSMLVCAPASAQVYGRLNLGWSSSVNVDIKDRDFNADQLICGDPGCNGAGKVKDVGGSAVVGAGVGWDLGNNVRADAMVNYRGGFKADETQPDGTNFKSDVKSWNLMLNGYYDFGMASLKPYVGLGVGVARNKVSDVRATNPVAPGLVVSFPEGAKTSFAWSVSAGMGIPVSGVGLFDVALSYVELGNIETDAGQATAPGVLPTSYAGSKGKLKAWELTIGLRF